MMRATVSLLGFHMCNRYSNLGGIAGSVMYYLHLFRVRKNLNVNDVVMLKYQGNMKDDYRLAIVRKTFKDKKGLVRTVRVGFRKRDKREPSSTYWRRPLTEEIVPVQRLSILQAAGEPVPNGTIADQLPLYACARLAAVKAALVKFGASH